MFVILLACTVQKELLLSDYMIASEVILLIISNYIVPVKVEVGSVRVLLVRVCSLSLYLTR